MRILFEVGHPADVHFFRNAIGVLRARGHTVSIAAVSKEVVRELLHSYGLDYELIGSNTPTILGKALTLAAKDLKLIRVARRNLPDLMVSFGSPYVAHASALLGVPHIAFTDTEIAKAAIKIMLPFTDAVCTPSCFAANLGPKHFRFDSYKELAYLHPKWFRPNPEVLERIGAHPGEKLIIVRLGLLASSHDFRHRGLDLKTDADRISFVKTLEKHGRVLLTSESTLDPGLRDRALILPATELHSVLCYASLYVGDGATTASESGVLGTPWVYVSTRPQGVQADQQRRYGLGFIEPSAQNALARAESILERPGLKAEWQAKREKMLSEKIDVTHYMVNLLEGWPTTYRTGRSATIGAPLS